MVHRANPLEGIVTFPNLQIAVARGITALLPFCFCMDMLVSQLTLFPIPFHKFPCLNIFSSLFLLIITIQV